MRGAVDKLKFINNTSDSAQLHGRGRSANRQFSKDLVWMRGGRPGSDANRHPERSREQPFNQLLQTWLIIYCSLICHLSFSTSKTTLLWSESFLSHLVHS
jgi:hypothetical protein